MAIEIERRFLLGSVPPPIRLSALGGRAVDISQTYLVPDQTAPIRRLRQISGPDGTRFVYTTKTGTGLVRTEHETVIAEAAYRSLLAEADPAKRTIRKLRWLLPNAGRILEIDLFMVPADLLIAEIELEHAGQQIELPDWLDVIAEVTDDPRYGNFEIARRDWLAPAA